MARIVGMVAALVFIAHSASADDFRGKVAPILEAKCIRCHGEEVRKGHLALHTAEDALRGRPRGPVIEPGKPEASDLMESISGHEPSMPKGGPPLSAAEVEAIRTWIEAGATWPDGLMLRDPNAPPPPWWRGSTAKAVAVPAAAILLVLAFAAIRLAKRLKSRRSLP